MADENDKFWKDAKGKLRRAANLDPMCREEAEAEVKRTKNSKPMSDDDVNSIMSFVLSIGERGGLPVEREEAAEEDEDDEDNSGGWVDPVTAEMMDEQILQLNSNAGEKDPEAEALLEKLRREALGDDAANDKHDIEDAPRLGDGKDADGAGDGGS